MSWRVKRLGARECVMAFPEVPSKQRPRYDRRHSRTYTPSKTLRAERDIRSQWVQACGTAQAGFEGEVRVYIEIQRPLSKSNPEFWAGRADLMKPDADNVAKVICDSLNGVAYRDDSQITQLAVTFDPRTPYSDTCLVKVRVEYFQETHVKDVRGN